MKIDGDKFMKWLHKIREEKTIESKKIGIAERHRREAKVVEEILSKYKIPVVRV